METFGDLSVALDTVLLRKSQTVLARGSDLFGDRTPPPTHPFPVIVSARQERVFGVGSSLGLVAQLVRARA